MKIGLRNIKYIFKNVILKYELYIHNDPYNYYKYILISTRLGM